MLYRISVAERGLTGIANIFRSRLSGLDDLLRWDCPFKDIKNLIMQNLQHTYGKYETAVRGPLMAR